jgi:hypothetical protein
LSRNASAIETGGRRIIDLVKATKCERDGGIRRRFGLERENSSAINGVCRIRNSTGDHGAGCTPTESHRRMIIESLFCCGATMAATPGHDCSFFRGDFRERVTQIIPDGPYRRK